MPSPQPDDPTQNQTLRVNSNLEALMNNQNSISPYSRVKCQGQWVGGGNTNNGDVLCRIKDYQDIIRISETETAKILGYRSVPYMSMIFRGLIIPPGITMLKIAALFQSRLPDIDLDMGDLWLLKDKNLIAKLKKRALLEKQINDLDNDLSKYLSVHNGNGHAK